MNERFYFLLLTSFFSSSQWCLFYRRLFSIMRELRIFSYVGLNSLMRTRLRGFSLIRLSRLIDVHFIIKCTNIRIIPNYSNKIVLGDVWVYYWLSADPKVFEQHPQNTIIPNYFKTHHFSVIEFENLAEKVQCIAKYVAISKNIPNNLKNFID